jgi:uncharacterized protein (TIGR00369 family)
MAPGVDIATVQGWLDTSPFNAWLAPRVVSLDGAAGQLVLRVQARPELMRLPGSDVFHGGPLAALADIAGDFAVAAAVGGGVPTVQLAIDYLKPCAGVHVEARARLRRLGRTLGWVDIDLCDATGGVCAIARGHYLAHVG